MIQKKQSFVSRNGVRLVKSGFEGNKVHVRTVPETEGLLVILGKNPVD